MLSHKASLTTFSSFETSLVSFISGSYVGTVIALPMSGLLAEYVGWEWIFYVFGLVGLLWCLAWWWIVRDSPEDDRHISDQVIIKRSNKFNHLLNKFMSSSKVASCGLGELAPCTDTCLYTNLGLVQTSFKIIDIKLGFW